MRRSVPQLIRTSLAVLMPVALLLTCSCDEKGERERQPRGGTPITPVAASRIGPDASAVPVDMSEGWCAGHGVPESVCSRCNSSLIAKFKTAGDWCDEHDLPESQCTNCNPAARQSWAALNPAIVTNPTGVSGTRTIETAKAELGPASSPVQPTLDQGWCRGHGVPESVCTRCNSALIPTFKDAGDWCLEHILPESQCAVCNPEVEAEWAKLNPARQTDDRRGDVSGGEGLIRLELNRRLLTASNDSLCQVDRLRIRFLDPSTARNAGIETEVVQVRSLSNTIERPAEVSFDETRMVRITPRLPGVVKDAVVEVGSFVKAGDLLAVLDSPSLGLTKSRYIRTQEEYLLSMADYERADAIHQGTQLMLEVCTALTPSDEVRRKLRAVRVGDAKGRLLQAHAKLELAGKTLGREQTLFDEAISSEQDLQKAQSNLAAAEAGFQSAYEAVGFDSERARLAALRTFNVAKSEMDAVARELGILGLSESQLTALPSESGVALSRYELRSPADGRIVERRAVVGEVVEPRDVLYTVVDLSTMWVMMHLRERDLTLVRVGLPVLFTVDGLPGHAFDGLISWISDTVNDRTRTLMVRADIPNEQGLLRANMFGLARIVLHDNDDVVSVSSQAVQTDGCCQLVFVKLEDTLFEPRKVSLGASANGHVEILTGLVPGESVVTVGSFLMKTEILKSNIGAGCCDVDPGR